MRLKKHTKQNKIRISIIIPVFNQSHQIGKCLETVLSPFYSHVEREILLINDGSTDNSEEMCLKYAEKYPQVTCFTQENKGVSAARNLGLQNATGKYIFFLDADDKLERKTIEKVTDFFESIQDEVDLVTYPISTIYEGRFLEPHFRYQYLKDSGVYDLGKMPYIGQTTMNIVVRNKFQENILFDENQSFSEDQKYCCDILKEKLKIGYCSEGNYMYYRSNNSSSGRLAGACYIFEQCTHFFEELFSEYENDVPAAFQGLFVNDFYWKLCSNILLPYHYGNKEYTEAVERLVNLLKRCDNSVILNHPHIDFFEKYYMLRMKNNSHFCCKIDDGGFGLSADNICYINEKSLEAVLTRIMIKENQIFIEGFLKSVFFQFYQEMPTLCAVENEGKLVRKLTLRPSAHNYYLSHEPTQRFWAFTYEGDLSSIEQLRFEFEVGGRWFPIHYYFMPHMPFSHKLKRYTYLYENVKIQIDGNNVFHFSQVEKEEKRIIWLYYDCKGVSFDNGMRQFLHDYSKRDGIERRYIVSDERQKAFLPDEKYGVEFGSEEHRSFFLQADKIITAYIEEGNIIPFKRVDYEKVSDKFKFEVIYLQHGVLHIDMPWKYSPEKILANRVVVSTRQEAELFMKNGFKETNLIKSRMPRFDKVSQKTRGKNRILLAPSWRAYLVGEYKERKWEMLDEKFQSSVYFKKLNALLTNQKLIRLLERNDYILEFKLHPIFAGYGRYFNVDSDRIHIVMKEKDIPEYKLFITDFSSFMYDFLYQNIPVLLFMPDEIEFKSGMNGYRRMGNNEEYWNRVTTEQEDLLENIRRYIEAGEYDRIQADFYNCKNPCDEIYNHVLM